MAAQLWDPSCGYEWGGSILRPATFREILAGRFPDGLAQGVNLGTCLRLLMEHCGCNALIDRARQRIGGSPLTIRIDDKVVLEYARRFACGQESTRRSIDAPTLEAAILLVDEVEDEADREDADIWEEERCEICHHPGEVTGG
jgi:hypothetical protein